MEIRCKRESCKLNTEGYCTASVEEMTCEKDHFHCKVCGYHIYKKNPLDTKRCPNCRTTKWDIGDIKCWGCGHIWVPKTESPKRCPNCGRGL